MTDRVNALVVVLEKDVRIDDVASLTDAIRQLRGVISVTPHIADGLTDSIAMQRVRHELGQKLWAVLYPSKP